MENGKWEKRSKRLEDGSVEEWLERELEDGTIEVRYAAPGKLSNWTSREIETRTT